MSVEKEPNGIWKALALTTVAVLQGLSLWTLADIKTDIRTIQADQQIVRESTAATKVQLAFIAARHALEDSKLPKPTP